MRIHKIIPASDGKLPFMFGGDSAHVSEWPKNPEGQDLLLLFTIDCKVARQRLNRTDLPAGGFLHVFSTYDSNEYFIDSITVDEVQLQKGMASYTYVVHADDVEPIKSPRPSIPLQLADFEETTIDDDELSVLSLIADEAPAGALIPVQLSVDYNFLCQIYSSDFPAPFEDALYMTDGVGYLLINKQIGGGKSDGCFFVQVA
ncbi:DUF1963 domain-containing protein [Pseudomonas plecoglossicida]|uniref:DUF1963 domain-containing protein n=1 Tax=Pseudomonas plecoglossicida TaxID=70775 RepID=UPI0012DCDD3C|nr:DUF1963 domain-containing protein [Pseudomonas plecoglossicida]GLR36212.1 hypothetical protein GCM10011247_16090 [Pseudomonas plecoglossicida]